MIENAIRQAQRMHRKALEATYDGRMIVSEYQQVTDPVTKLTACQEVTVLEAQPCRLSFDRVQQAEKERGAEAVFQVIRLFTAPELAVKPGSKIAVTQNGVTTVYQCSGIPAVYATHQEVILDLFERWS